MSAGIPAEVQASQDLHLWRSRHPGAKTLRRCGFYLLVFTLPTVLVLTGVVAEPRTPEGAGLFLYLGWVMMGIFAPIMSLWFGWSRIASYLSHFPGVRRTVGFLLLLAGLATGVMGYFAMTDPSIQSRRRGAPLVFAVLLVAAGWGMVRGKKPSSS